MRSVFQFILYTLKEAFKKMRITLYKVNLCFHSHQHLLIHCIITQLQVCKLLLNHHTYTKAHQGKNVHATRWLSIYKSDLTCVVRCTMRKLQFIPKSGRSSCHEKTLKGPVTHYRRTSPELNRSTKLTTARQSAELRQDSTWKITIGHRTAADPFRGATGALPTLTKPYRSNR